MYVIVGRLSTVYLDEVDKSILETVNVSFRNRLMTGSTFKGNQLK